jgi:hypothetical protein
MPSGRSTKRWSACTRGRKGLGGVGEYFRSWVDRHPRSERTNKTNSDRISSVLDVEIDGLPLRDWEFDELRRRHALALVDHMLRVQGRAAQGARGIVSACGDGRGRDRGRRRGP